LQTLTAGAQPNGSYSVAAGAALVEGTYTAQATQQDTAGNAGASSSNTFTIGASYQAEVLTDGPRAYWRLGETSGTVAADAAGTNPGTYTGGVTLGQPSALAGDTNASASFDGVNDYVGVPDSNSLDLTTAVTVEAWVKRSKSAAWQVVVGKSGNGQSAFENYAVWLDTSNQLVAYFGNGTSFARVVAPAIDTNWHHVAATYDNATAKIYVDGAMKASTASTVQMGANNLPLNIGRANNSTAYQFGGRLDDVAIYPSALAANRVLAHYNAGIGLDSSAPVVSLAAPANGSATTDSTPTLAGNAGTASGDSATITVKVYSGGSASGAQVRTMTATRQADTSYSIDASPALADGTYTAQAEQIDSAGNVGRSTANTFAIDNVGPSPTLTAPTNGAVKNPPPTFAGQGGTANGDSSNVTVKVYAGAGTGGTVVRTLIAPVAAGGSFSVDATPPLSEGTYTAQVEQTDGVGNLGRSSANSFTVTTADVTPPSIALTAPANGTATTVTTPTFAGTAGTATGDSSTVTVKLYAGSAPTGTPLQVLSAVSGPAGSYSVAAAALGDGTYTGQAEQADQAGNVGRSQPTTFRVDRIAPAVALASPADGSSTNAPKPAFSGTMGTAVGDSSTATVKLYAGSGTGGTPIQTLVATAGAGGAFSVSASSNLQPGSYTAQAEQSDAAGNTGRSPANTFTVTTESAVLLAAGDIASCGSTGDEATAALLDMFPNATVAPVGDTAYDNGQPADFANCYDPTWGRAKTRSRPVIGDHEYAAVSGGTPPGAAFFDYFHDQLAPYGSAATDPAKGYYSYDLGAWHVVVLNASCYNGIAPGCDTALQEQWFENDLAANQSDCTIAMWHKPRFSSGSIHGPYLPTQQFWETAYDHGVELVLSGDDHVYERFGRMDAAGNADSQLGVRQFIVGMGGYSHYTFGTIQPNSQVRNDNAFGILKLTLRANDYDWEFVPEAGRIFADAGTETCHAAPPPPPPGSPSVRSVSSNVANHPSTSITLSKPAGAVPGDVLLAIAAHQSGSATNLSAPGGWTAVPNTDYSDGNAARIHAWYKITGSAEPSSYTFTLSGAGQAIAGGIVAITGATSTPINASLGQVNGTSSFYLTAPSITTTSAKTLLVYAGAVNAPLAITPPAFMGERFDVRTNGSFNVSLEAATQVIASSGATGVRTAYLSGGSRGPAIAVALTPSSP